MSCTRDALCGREVTCTRDALCGRETGGRKGEGRGRERGRGEGKQGKPPGMGCIPFRLGTDTILVAVGRPCPGRRRVSRWDHTENPSFPANTNQRTRFK